MSYKVTKEQREQAIDAKQHWRVVAVVKFKDGRCGIKVLPRIQQRIVNYYTKVGSSKDVERVELYMSNNVYFNRFPNSSVLNAHYVDIEEINKNIKGAEPLVFNPSQPRQSKADRPQWHVIAVITLEDGRCGIKVLPRVLPSILSYYNGVKEFEEVADIRLFMNFHLLDRAEVVAHLKNAEKMSCDGTTLKRHQK